MPTERDVPHERTHTQEAVRLVGNFLRNVYGEVIPPEIQTRFDRLSVQDAITVSDQELTKVLVRGKTNPYGVAGKYDLDADRIYLRSDASLHDHVHEIFHFIAANPNEKASGFVVRGKMSVGKVHKPNRLNEGATELLTFMAVNHLDIHDQATYGRIRVRSRSQQASLSYRTFTSNLHDQLQYDPKRRTKQLLLFLATSYLSRDLDSFLTKIDRPEDLDALPAREVTKSRYWLKLLCPQASDRIPKNLYRYLFRLITMLDGQPDPDKKIDLQYVYPEHGSGLVQVTSGLEVVGIQVPTRIHINLGLGDDRVRRELLSGHLKNHLAREAFILWQLVKIKIAEVDGVDLPDREFFSHQTIRDYLARIPAYSLDTIAISTMARYVLGAIESTTP